ncbi:MAG: cell division protein ZapA [Chitinophagales bacterium]
MNKQQLNIKVEIADKPYRLQVSPEDEEFVRTAADYIKQKMKEMKGQYSSSEKQDYLAMVCLLICVDLLKQDRQQTEKNKQLEDKLSQLDGILSNFLEEKG